MDLGSLQAGIYILNPLSLISTTCSSTSLHDSFVNTITATLFNDINKSKSSTSDSTVTASSSVLNTALTTSTLPTFQQIIFGICD